MGTSSKRVDRRDWLLEDRVPRGGVVHSPLGRVSRSEETDDACTVVNGVLIVNGNPALTEFRQRQSRRDCPLFHTDRRHPQANVVTAHRHAQR